MNTEDMETEVLLARVQELELYIASLKHVICDTVDVKTDTLENSHNDWGFCYLCTRRNENCTCICAQCEQMWTSCSCKPV